MLAVPRGCWKGLPMASAKVEIADVRLSSHLLPLCVARDRTLVKQRSGHSMTAVKSHTEAADLLVLFGGGSAGLTDDPLLVSSVDKTVDSAAFQQGGLVWKRPRLGTVCPNVIHHTANVIDIAGTPHLIVFGGFEGTGSVSDALYIMNIATYSWSSINKVEEQSQTFSAWPLPRAAHSAQVDAGTESLYVFGGCGSRGTGEEASRLVYFNDLWRFHILSMTWSAVELASPLGPAPRAHHASALSPDGASLLVYGGRGDDHRIFSDLWIFEFATRQWRLVSDTLPARFGHRSELVDGSQLLVSFGWSPGMSHPSALPQHHGDGVTHVAARFDTSIATNDVFIFDLSHALQAPKQQGLRLPGRRFVFPGVAARGFHASAALSGVGLLVVAGREIFDLPFGKAKCFRESILLPVFEDAWSRWPQLPLSNPTTQALLMFSSSQKTPTAATLAKEGAQTGTKRDLAVEEPGLSPDEVESTEGAASRGLRPTELSTAFPADDAQPQLEDNARPAALSPCYVVHCGSTTCRILLGLDPSFFCDAALPAGSSSSAPVREGSSCRLQVHCGQEQIAEIPVTRDLLEKRRLTLTGLHPACGYELRFFMPADSPSGEGNEKAWESAQVQGAAYTAGFQTREVSAPSVPFQCKLAERAGRRILSWSAPLDGGGLPLTSYVVVARDKASGRVLLTETVPTEHCEYVLPELDAVSSEIVVRAVSAAGAGPCSRPVVLHRGLLASQPGRVADSVPSIASQ